MSDNYETDPPVDPSTTIVHDLIYGDPDEAGTKLRGFVQSEAVAAVQGHAFAQRRNAELAAGHRLVQEFKEREPDWVDGGVVEGAMTQQLKNEQIADLEAAKLLDRDWFHEKNGRFPTDQEIFNWHLDARAMGLPVRSIGDLFESAATAVERKTGLRRHTNSIEANRKRAVADRIDQTRTSRDRNREIGFIRPTNPTTPRRDDAGTVALDSLWAWQRDQVHMRKGRKVIAPDP